jgi:hypothetical protein
MRLTAVLLTSLILTRVWAGEDAYFYKEVFPVLDSKCIKCHGPEKKKGALRLDSREALLKGGESGPAIVVGKPEESLLVKLVHHKDDERTMPPKEKLKPNEITAIEIWIKDGAVWPERKEVAPVLKPGEKLGDAWTDPRNPIVRIFHGQRLDLWSFKPLAAVKTPAQGNPIDVFMAEKGKLAPPCERAQLVRRVYLDLTGLPPTPQESDAFVADNAPDAYEKLVDKLLASPRYGEHWGRWWLDAVRYSDSNGFDWDEFRPLVWRYRDYVIRSLNNDKPYDRFVREQLAGDEMVPGAPKSAEDQDALIATSYLRLGPWDNSAGNFGEQAKVRQQLMNDLVETTGAAFLGISMSCCRCHDHKTDPISQADYYRMRAFFEAVKFSDDLALDLAPEQEAIKQHNAAVEKELEPARKLRAETLVPAKARKRAERVAKLRAEDQALLAQANPDDAAKTKIKELEKKIEVSDDDAKKILTVDEKKSYEAAEAGIKALKDKMRSFTTGLCAIDGDAPKPTRVLFQGNVAEPREEVVPGFLSALDPNAAELRKTSREKSTGRRTTLAEWIVAPTNPLTARVLVNRIWQGHFGTGLVATANDFGLAGQKPVFPDLLDWLAAQFMRDGWSLKKLHKLIVTSDTYKQAPRANAAPLGPSLRRLSAEQLRDSMLAVSGLLNESASGAPVWPKLPDEVLRANPAVLDGNATNGKGWYPSKPEQLNVRSIFMVQKRTMRVPFMEIFDLPDNAVSCPRRNMSTVAPQALTLLNNPFTIDCATAFAKRVETEAGQDTAAQVKCAFKLALQRSPNDEELSSCLKLREKRSLMELCRSLMNLNEFIYVD